MQVQLSFITVRVNGIVEDVESIKDIYSEVQLEVYKDKLELSAIDVLRKNGFQEQETHFILYAEAKDLVLNISNLKISIDSITHEVN